MNSPVPQHEEKAPGAAECLSRRNVVLFLVLLVALAMEGADVKVLSFAAPQILNDWGVSNTAFSSAFAATLIGMAPGTAVGGFLGDRYGRRWIAILSTLTFGLCTFLIGFVHEVIALTVLRFISGLGFGALIPNAYALVVEWIPARWRSPALSVLTVATPIGGALTAGIVVWAFPVFGWRSTIMALGIATCCIASTMVLVLPESRAFLDSKRKRTAAIGQFGKRRELGLKNSTRHEGDLSQPNGTTAPKATHASNSEASEAKASLFERRWLLLVTSSAVIMFSIHFINFMVSSWLPVIITQAGLEIADALGAVFAYNLFAIIGGLATVNLAAFFGSRGILVGVCALLIALLAGMPFLIEAGSEGGSYLLILKLASGLIGLGVGGAAALMAAVLSMAYPVEIRSAGVGFAFMWSRFGAILAIFAGGVLLDRYVNDTTVLFTILASIAVCGLVAAALFPNKQQEAPSRAQAKS